MNYNIIITGSNGADLTGGLAEHPSIDADRERDKPVGHLTGLNRGEAITALCQIIDNGHEWTTADVAGPLYDEAERMVDGAGYDYVQHMIVPDGWRVTLVSLPFYNTEEEA